MLYFAPINLLSNYVYRHIALEHGADYVFSELLLVGELDKAVLNDKLKLIQEDISRTIFQIGVSTPQDVFEGVSFVKEYVDTPFEINLNMGCPQSTMQQTKVCGGILYDVSLMGELAKALFEAVKGTTTIPSIKLRLGTNPETILIHDYLDIIQKNGIQKVYVHARTLRYGYTKRARYELLSGLREKYSDMNLIFNGDVDSYESYQLIGAGDVLIARAALSNPFIFEDIKQQKKYGVGFYNPQIKDLYLIRGTDIRFSLKKIDLIRTYLKLVVQYDLRKRLYCGNIKWLTKGVTGVSSLNKSLMQSTSALEAQKLFEDWLIENGY